MSCFVLSVFGRRVMAVSSVNRGNLARARSGLSSYTARRRAFKSFFSVIASFGYVGRLFESAASPLEGDDGTLWGEICSTLKDLTECEIGPYVVYFPSQPERKRAYISMENPGDRGRGLFAKVEYGPSSQGFENEVKFLAQFQKESKGWVVPRLLGSFFGERFRAILLDAFSADFSPVTEDWEGTPFSLRNKIIGVVRDAEIDQLGWWQRFVSTAHEYNAELPDLIVNYAASWHPVGIGHGDFSSSNIFEDKGQVVVADWESASTDAPFLLDELTYLLGRRHRKIAKDPFGSIWGVCEHITKECHRTLRTQRIDSILLSLAHLATTKNQEARIISACLSGKSIGALYELSR